MTLTRPHYIDKAWPNGIDLRKNLAGAFPREGLFPSAETLQGVAFAGTGWAVSARAFTAAFKRQGAPFSLAYGTGLGCNDGTVATAWTLGGAPGSGTRVDRLWVRWVDPTQGESLTTPGGETVARAVPVFGITPGTPAAAAWPAGVQPIAEVSVPAGAGSAAGATYTQVHPFANTIGGTIWVRTIAERDALVGVLEGEQCWVTGTDQGYVYGGASVGWVHAFGKPDIGAFTATGIYSASSPTPRVLAQGGRMYLEGFVTSSSATFVAGTQYDIGSIPAAFAPDYTMAFACTANSTAVAEVSVDTAGALRIKLSVGFTGPLALSLAGGSWADKDLT